MVWTLNLEKNIYASSQGSLGRRFTQLRFKFHIWPFLSGHQASQIPSPDVMQHSIGIFQYLLGILGPNHVVLIPKPRRQVLILKDSFCVWALTEWRLSERRWVVSLLGLQLHFSFTQALRFLIIFASDFRLSAKSLFHFMAQGWRYRWQLLA